MAKTILRLEPPACSPHQKSVECTAVEKKHEIKDYYKQQSVGEAEDDDTHPATKLEEKREEQ